MKKLKILYDYSRACRNDHTGIPIFVNHLYRELVKIDTIDIKKTFCVSSVLPTRPWIVFRFFEQILYHNLYLPLKLKYGKYDIYIENQYMFIPLFKPKNTKIVNVVYDIGLMLFDDIQTRKHTHNWRKKFPVSIDNSDMLITISDSSKKDIKKYLTTIKSTIPVEYIYANIDKIEPCKNKNILNEFNIAQGYFLFLGTLEPRKNPLKLLEAFRLFKSNTNTTIKLVIAGKKGWLYDDVLSYIDQYDLENEVIITGYVSLEVKACLLQNAKAFLFLSRYEGFGIPPLEALHFNTPVLLSDIQVFHELFGNCVLYTNPLDIEETAKRMKEVLTTPPTIDLTLFNKFSWKDSAYKLVEIIKSMSKDKR